MEKVMMKLRFPAGSMETNSGRDSETQHEELLNHKLTPHIEPETISFVNICHIRSTFESRKTLSIEFIHIFILFLFC